MTPATALRRLTFAPGQPAEDTQPQPATMRNLLSIDVEDYFHATGLGTHVGRDRWDQLPGRVEYNARRFLQILDRYDVQATFFVLGWVAKRYPDLIREIHDAGHEIASHGWDHRLVYEMDPESFAADVARTRDLLEQVTGSAVFGYRAPSFSIVPQSWWALEVLALTGHRYDSSVFPIRRRRYGVPDSPRGIHRILEVTTDHGGLIEVPPPAIELLGRNVPVAGGGYFRAFPMRFTEWAIRRMNQQEARPAMVYLHPWEIDPDQPRLPGTRANRFRHYLALDRTEARLSRLLQAFPFGPIRDALGLEEAPAPRRVATTAGELVEPRAAFADGTFDR